MPVPLTPECPYVLHGAWLAANTPRPFAAPVAGHQRPGRRPWSQERRLAQSVALRFGFQYGILPLLCLSPDAISRAAGCSLSLLAPIVAPSSLIVTASAATSLRFYGNFGERPAFCWSAGF